MMMIVENSWISDGLPNSSRRRSRAREGGRGESGERNGVNRDIFFWF